MAAARRMDAGFTLVELVVVMVILGVLAAVAIPLFLNQREKAEDAAARQDLRNVALAILSIVEKQPTLPALTVVDGAYYIDGEVHGTLSPNVVLGALQGTSINDWCVDVSNPEGDIAATSGYHYTAADGLTEGAC